MGDRNESRAETYRLRAALRPLARSRRVRDCGRRVVAASPAVRVVESESGERDAWWTGVLRCGRQYACPVCSARRASKRAGELTRMMAADGQGAWRMVTLTLRHDGPEPLASQIDRLLGAWRKTRATRAVRTIFDARVTASVRALEVTRGARGWHPHIHLIVRSDAWSEGEQATLEREWLRRVPGLAGVAVRWSDSPALYIAKLGSEVAGVGKRGRQGSLGPWQIAELALSDARMAARWAEYQDAMRGRRILEADERAKALMRASEDAPEPARVWDCVLYTEEYSAIARFESCDPWVFWLGIEAALSGPDPPGQVQAWADDVLFGGSYGSRAA